MSKICFCVAGCIAVALLLSVFPGTALAEEKRLLCGFNSQEETDAAIVTKSKIKIVADHATEGTRCARLVLDGKKSQYPGFSLPRKLLSGWERFDALAFDVFNEGAKPERIAIRIDDPQSTVWTTWYHCTFTAVPGRNHFEIELAKLLTHKTNRQIDVSKITRFIVHLDFGRRDKDDAAVLYFDNLVLKKSPKVEFPEGLKAFDFGTESSKVWPGFTKVLSDDRFSDKRGYGFSSTANRRSYDYKTPDTIGRDSVFGAKLTFTVKVKPGNYKVWVVTGQMRHPWNTFPRRPFWVRAEGEERFSFKPKSDKYLENLEYLSRDYRRKGPSLWDLYVAPRYSEPAFTVNCSDGKLDISFEKNIFLAGLALWPVADEKAEKIIADIGVARRKEFHASWREVKPVTLSQLPRPTRKEKKCGFMLAYRNYLESITPYFVPVAADRLKKLSIAACPGEYEPGVFIIYPVRDQKDVTVKVGDLVGKGGKIPASCIKIERAVYRHVTRGGTYTVSPMHLVPRASVDVEAGVPRQFWLTIKVPDKAKAGRYQGKVTVGAGEQTLDFPFELEVYPFKLSPHNITYAHVYSAPNDEQRIEMDLRCLVEHGFNSVTTTIPGWGVKREGGRIILNFKSGDRLMKMMKKLGMTGPVPLFGMIIQGYAGGTSSTPLGIKQAFGYTSMDPRYLNDLTLVTKAIIEHAKENQWLPVIMYSSSEISNDKNLGPKFQRKLIQAIRKAGEVKVVASVNSPHDVESVKDLDIIMYNGGVPINEKTIKAAHDAGCELWFQNIGGTRFNDGLYLLRTGAKGRRQWVLNWDARNDQYSDFDNCAEGRDHRIFSSPEGTLPSISLERMREGVDDYRYFWTLKLLIEKAAKQGTAKAEAAAAQKDYDEMIASCPVEMDLHIPIGKDGFVVNKGFRDMDTFDRYRKRVAGHIIKLKKALREL